MKKLFSTLFLICVVSLLIAQKDSRIVNLKGQLKNFSSQVEVEDLSDMQYLLPPTSERMFVPDKDGNFNITFKVESPNYFRIGRNILYLSPGDNMEVFIDKSNCVKATFKGKGSAANLYLRNTPFPKGGSFVEAGAKIQRTIKGTIDTLLQMAANRRKELVNWKGISPEFRRLEAARVKADLINSLEDGEIYSIMRLKLKGDSAKAFSEEYESFIKPLVTEYSKNFEDASLMKLVVYRDIAGEILKQPGKQKDLQQIKDWITASTLNDQMKKVSDKKQLIVFTKRIDSVKTKTYHNALQKDLASLLKFGKGDLASDFNAIDIDGRSVSLNSLKGRVIYVDLWATWCGPCMAEMPHYDSLKLKYKGDPNIAFVSLSIDDGMDVWKNNVVKRNGDGNQWLINRTKLLAYNVVGIPRSLLIDKNFRIVSLDAPLPSSKELPGMINDLEHD